MIVSLEDNMYQSAMIMPSGSGPCDCNFMDWESYQEEDVVSRAAIKKATIAKHGRAWWNEHSAQFTRDN